MAAPVSVLVAVCVCVSVCVTVSWGQPHSHDPFAWDPVTDPELALGPSANLSTHNNDTVRILMDTEYNFLAIKDLSKFTCYILALTPANLTADDVIEQIEDRGIDVVHSDFRPASQTDKEDVRNQFGPRVGHFCLHNPTFFIVKAADSVPTPQMPASTTTV